MKLLLVDGSNVVRRYAFALLGDGQGHPSPSGVARVLRGVGRAIRECAEVAGCGHAIVATDPEGETWRKALYPEYKANRPATGFPWVRTLTEHCAAEGWYCAEAAGFEADDAIATLAGRAHERGHRPAILSSDSDLLQLVGELAAVYQFGNKAEARFVERSPLWVAGRYGLRDSAQLALYKALVGEPGDNLPGVAGIGPKKAAALLATYRMAEEIFEAGVFAREKREQLALMLSLTRLRFDAPLPPVTPAWCALAPAAPPEGATGVRG